MAIGSERAMEWLPERSRLIWSAGVIASLLFLAVLASRLPVRSSVLVNWDSVQLALATDGIDVEQHRPHPPGYIGYVVAGKALNLATGDANVSFVLISMVASAAAAALFYLLARKLLTPERALFAAVLFGTSPLLWYYGGVALTYAAEGALATAFGLCVWQSRQGDGRWLIVASLLLAVLGAVRQTGEVLLLPLWLWAAVAAAPALRLQAGAVLVAASLVWLVPLMWLAGGPVHYFNESVVLADSASASTSVYRGAADGIGVNLGFVFISLAAALGAALFFLAVHPRDLIARLRAFPSREVWFYLVWAMPALIVFLFVHMGQAGYVLLLLPPLFLAVIRLQPRVSLSTRAGRVLLCGMVIANVLTVFYLPGAVYRSLPPESKVAGQLRQFIPAQNDAYWGEIIDFAGHFDPETTAILTAVGGPNSNAGFRHLGYYLPDYNVYALGWGRQGGFGLLYSTFERHDNYRISGASLPSPILWLGMNVRTLIVTDWSLVSEFDFSFPLLRHQMPGGSSVWIAEIPRGTTLIFRPPGFRGIVNVATKPVVDALKPRASVPERLP